MCKAGNNCQAPVRKGAYFNRQKGLSMPSLLMLFIIGGVIVTCIIKMGPVYYDNWNFRSILEDIETEFSGVGTVDKTVVRKRIQKRMSIDMIKSIKSKDVTITRDGDAYVVGAQYEARVSLLGNVDVVMKFDDKVYLSLVK